MTLPPDWYVALPPSGRRTMQWGALFIAGRLLGSRVVQLAGLVGGAVSGAEWWSDRKIALAPETMNALFLTGKSAVTDGANVARRALRKVAE